MGNKYDTDYNYTYNFQFNYESQVAMQINLPKVCYSKGDTINGTIHLKTKPYLQETILYNPVATISLKEYQRTGEPDTDFDIYNSTPTDNKNLSKKEKIYFQYQLLLYDYNGANLLIGVDIPFSIKLPLEMSSSCLLDNNNYIRHYLVIDFISIRAKKSQPIIIKNNKYYSLENKLYKSPIVGSLQTSKHKYALFNMGEIKASFTLPKNCFKYDENIYFILEIDSSKLSININSVKISLDVYFKLNETPGNNENNNNNNLNKIEINSKKIMVKKGLKNYYIDDFIKLPEDNKYNPEFCYKKYDQKKKIEYNNDNILFQPCYEGIINCQYMIKALIEINSMFSTNEFIEIPIDFYEDDKIKDETDNINNNNINNNINKNNSNEEDDLPSLEDIIQNRENKEKNNINENGFYDINHIDNENYYNENNNNNYKENEDDSGAPPTFGDMMKK